MSKYAAQIENDVVVQVLVTPSLAWVRDNLGGEWIECKPDGSIRGMYPAPRYIYDRANDVFLPPSEEPEPA
jgi:hypothetical protein